MSTEDNGHPDTLSPAATLRESQRDGATGTETDAPERATTAERARADDIAAAIDDATKDGMYPLIAFGLDKDNRPSQALLVTSSIPDMVLAWDMLDRFLPQGYAFSGYVPWSRLEIFADTHRMIVRKHSISIPNPDPACFRVETR
jgi:hypothetical protein